MSLYQSAIKKRDSIAAIPTGTTVAAHGTYSSGVIPAACITQVTPLLNLTGSVVPAVTVKGSFDGSEWHTIGTVAAGAVTQANVLPVYELQLRVDVDNSANVGTATVAAKLTYETF